MRKIAWYLLLLSVSCFAMQTEQKPHTVSDIEKYNTFLYYTWGPKLYEFHQNNPLDAHAKKLERFKNNYLAGAILYKYLKKCTVEEAARLSFRNTPSCACALHNILHGALDDFDEKDYAHTDLIARWRDELECIEKNLTDSREK